VGLHQAFFSHAITDEGPGGERYRKSPATSTMRRGGSNPSVATTIPTMLAVSSARQKELDVPLVP
jgi:hypothetical protein